MFGSFLIKLIPRCSHFKLPDLVDLLQPLTMYRLHIERSCIHPESRMSGPTFTIDVCIHVHPISGYSDLRFRQNPNGPNSMFVKAVPIRRIQSE